MLLPFIMVLCLSQSVSAKQVTQTLPEIAIAKAKSYIGIKETSYNSSPQIDTFIKDGGGHPGWPWCMYLVRYCFNYASKILNVVCPLKRTGSVCDQLQYCVNSSRVKVFFVNDYSHLKVLPGDIMIMRNGYGFDEKKDLKRNWNGHTGINEKQISDRIIQTIEGNTNAVGGREGNCVARKTRDLHSRNKLHPVAIMRVL